MEILKINTDVESLKQMLLEFFEENKLYSRDMILGYLVTRTHSTIEEIDSKLDEVLQMDDLVSYDNTNIPYAALLRLDEVSINKYFLSKLGKDKEKITKFDLTMSLRCLPMEKRDDCRAEFYSIFGKNNEISYNPQQLYMLYREPQAKKDQKYVVEDNLESFAVDNPYVVYNPKYAKSISKRDTILKNLAIGTGAALAITLGIVTYNVLSKQSEEKNTYSMSTEQLNTLRTVDDEIILSWLDETIDRHREITENSEYDYIKNLYNEKINKLYFEAMHIYYQEYIRATNPEYFYNNVILSDEKEDLYDLAYSLGELTPQDGKEQHNKFLNKVEELNDSLLDKSMKFENTSYAKIDTNSKKLILKQDK